MSKTIYYTEEGLRERIRELREMRELSLEREAELVLLHDGIRGKENAVITNSGQIIVMGDRPKETAYTKNKSRADRLSIYRERLNLKKPKWVH